LKKTILTVLTGMLFFVACVKDDFKSRLSAPEPCVEQTFNPSGISYSSDSVTAYQCTSKHCGIIPLSTKSFWIYEDSIYTDGIFQRVQYDTLRYSVTFKTPDNITWWQKSSVSIGLPEVMYTNDSAIFDLSDRMFIAGIKDVKKEYSLFTGDSSRYLTSFEDAAAMGRALKVSGSINTPAGIFTNCLYFEKNARNYRKDQIFFKPGIGVIKYIQEKAPMGERDIRLQQKATLIKYYIQ
jgi:hypothetical protein